MALHMDTPCVSSIITGAALTASTCPARPQLAPLRGSVIVNVHTLP